MLPELHGLLLRSQGHNGVSPKVGGSLRSPLSLSREPRIPEIPSSYWGSYSRDAMFSAMDEKPRRPPGLPGSQLPPGGLPGSQADFCLVSTKV